MKFTDLFIKRPVLATVLSLMLLVLGLKAFGMMQVRQYPELETGVITITTQYPGASASSVQGYVTQPLQAQIAQTAGIDYMTSDSSLGKSLITVYLKLDYPSDKALTEILSLVQQVKYRLPAGVLDPSILKSTSQSPILYLSFSSDTLATEQISDYISRVVKPTISTVSGVSKTDILGQRDFAMRIWLNPTKMAAFGITAADVQNAIKGNNAVSAAGKVKDQFIEVDINAHTDASSVAEFKHIALKASDGRLIHMEDVATVELGANSYDSVVNFNGKPAVLTAISNTSNSNPLTVAADVYTVLPSIIDSLPAGMKADVVYDSTKYIQTSIDEVAKTLMEAALIVVIVIFAFLGSMRAMMIPLVTIPLSLIGSMFFMLAMGFSINILTLLAMVLAISLVVDDAIVVVENTFRHLEDGTDPVKAAIISAREIAGPVFAMTITLAAVYAPIGFMGGLTGKLFTEFAFTLVGAVLISGFLALTLTPMMCSKVLSQKTLEGKLVKKIDGVIEVVTQHYTRMLNVVIDNRKLVWPFAATILIALVFMFTHTASELAPQEDQGVMIMMGKGPTTSNTNYLNHFTQPLTQLVDTYLEKDMDMMVNGYQNDQTFFGLAVLKDWSERDASAKDIMTRFQSDIKTIPGLQVYTFSPPDLPGTAQGLPFQMILKTPTGTYKDLYQYAEKMKDYAIKSGKFIYVQNDLDFSKPQIEVSIDRDKAALMNVDTQQIGLVLSRYLSEGFVNYFALNERSYQVITQVPQDDRRIAKDLTQYYVKSANEQMVSLASLVTITKSVQPSAVDQFQQLNSAMIEAKMMPGVSIGEAYTVMAEAAEQILPKSYSTDASGQLRQFLDEGSSLIATFFLAIIIIYLVLAAQFESFRDPLVVLTSVPLSIFGAMIPLYLGLDTLNIYTEVGLVTLIGLISKHGILIVEFANQLQAENGYSKREAAVKAAAVRLRPVLMTTAAMVIGVVPLLVAVGAGAESRFAIGLVITVGMSIGTLFTLFVLPTVYTFLAQDHRQDIEVTDQSNPAKTDATA
ncbi:multidrug efflux protein [Shewanella sp. Choline-02u-19]|uniref:efflux RND transporter permease subunit n=1 Tax=unclassified Shewanella TaxID=196818 RepID=UPI000C3375CF|nr:MULTISPECIES: efflux RND transporter permease subunit [unclassified Shewanella]PKH57063.1 multidrug efflux protein [Shewanella sp. Bg11-22]PKI27860.1 multidrug efflux protein [Shewanella sp. Choline-02u-19]